MTTTLFRFIGPPFYDIIFICGLYKSGTSLAAEVIESLDYFNPSRLTNPAEYGYSTTQNRYYTQECILLRKINQNFLPKLKWIRSWASKQSMLYDIFRTFSYKREISVKEYISIFPTRIILKDPQFVFTLPLWLKACYTLKRKVMVVFTLRDKSSLLEAWKNAPYTKELFNIGFLDLMLTALSMQFSFCNQYHIDHHIFNIEELRLLQRFINCHKSILSWRDFNGQCFHKPPWK